MLKRSAHGPAVAWALLGGQYLDPTLLLSYNRAEVSALQIRLLNWDEETAEHLWKKHRVRVHEAEQVVFSADKFIFRSRQGRYLILGQTEGGRYLLVVVENLYRRACDLVTAREMTPRERHRYLSQQS